MSAIIYIVGNAGGQGKSTMVVQRLAPFLGPTFVAPPVLERATMDVLATPKILNAFNIDLAIRPRAYARTTWIDSVSITAISLRSASTAHS